MSIDSRIKSMGVFASAFGPWQETEGSSFTAHRNRLCTTKLLASEKLMTTALVTMRVPKAHYRLAMWGASASFAMPPVTQHDILCADREYSITNTAAFCTQMLPSSLCKPMLTRDNEYDGAKRTKNASTYTPTTCTRVTADEDKPAAHARECHDFMNSSLEAGKAVSDIMKVKCATNPLPELDDDTRAACMRYCSTYCQPHAASSNDPSALLLGGSRVMAGELVVSENQAVPLWSKCDPKNNSSPGHFCESFMTAFCSEPVTAKTKGASKVIGTRMRGCVCLRPVNEAEESSVVGLTRNAVPFRKCMDARCADQKTFKTWQEHAYVCPSCVSLTAQHIEIDELKVNLASGAQNEMFTQHQQTACALQACASGAEISDDSTVVYDFELVENAKKRLDKALIDATPLVLQTLKDKVAPYLRAADATDVYMVDATPDYPGLYLVGKNKGIAMLGGTAQPACVHSNQHDPARHADKNSAAVTETQKPDAKQSKPDGSADGTEVAERTQNAGSNSLCAAGDVHTLQFEEEYGKKKLHYIDSWSMCGWERADWGSHTPIKDMSSYTVGEPVSAWGCAKLKSTAKHGLVTVSAPVTQPDGTVIKNGAFVVEYPVERKKTIVHHVTKFSDCQKSQSWYGALDKINVTTLPSMQYMKGVDLTEWGCSKMGKTPLSVLVQNQHLYIAENAEADAKETTYSDVIPKECASKCLESHFQHSAAKRQSLPCAGFVYKKDKRCCTFFGLQSMEQTHRACTIEKTSSDKTSLPAAKPPAIIGNANKNDTGNSLSGKEPAKGETKAETTWQSTIYENVNVSAAAAVVLVVLLLGYFLNQGIKKRELAP